MRKYFGTDGIRGVANRVLTPQLAMRLGFAAASPNMKICIGRDSRVSGAMLLSAFAAGAMSAGAKVIDCGIIPTPAISLLTRRFSADYGVVISASHNPVPDNGIKFFGADGYKLSEEGEERIEAAFDSCDSKTPPEGVDVGSISICEDATEYYVNYLKKLLAVDLTGMKVALDCACGAAYSSGPELLKSMGAEVIAINDHPDGSKINVACGSTNLASLSELVKSSGADFGIAFDGDADRALMVDENGTPVDGDQIIAMFALYLKEKGQLPHNKIVTTVMSNMGFEKMLASSGVTLLRAAVGDKNVSDMMTREGSVLGGEQSGHIILSDFNHTGDGTLTAGFAAKILSESAKSFSKLTELFTPMPQILLNVRVEDKDAYKSDAKFNEALENYSIKLKGRGRILVRPSGTEPIVRVMVEGEVQEEIESIANSLADLLR